MGIANRTRNRIGVYVVRSLRMRTRTSIALVLVCAASVSAGVALAQPGKPGATNPDATRSYLIARRKLERAGNAVAVHASAYRTVADQIQSSCANVLAGSPQGGGVLRQEAVAELDYAGRLAVRTAYLTFASKVAGLRWGSRQLTRFVHRQGTVIAASVSVTEPNICTDAKQFVSSGYKVEPAGTTRFLAERRTVEAEGAIRSSGFHEVLLGPAINEMLRPYEGRSDEALLVPVPASAAAERAFVVGLHEVLDALGLSE
jgi:hypothetical protein